MNVKEGAATLEKLAGGAETTCIVEFVPDPSLYMEQGVRIFEATFEEENPLSLFINISEALMVQTISD